jgi:hypothetical protein
LPKGCFDSSFIDAEEKKPSMMQNGYYPAEATTLNEQLQREVKYTGCFLASSIYHCSAKPPYRVFLLDTIAFFFL